jgi:outer membrane lipoprotein-sorting protein
MLQIVTRSIVFFAAFTLASTPALGDTLEQIKNKIHEKTSALKTLSYKTNSVSNVNTPEMSMKSVSDQFAQFSKQGDKVLSRLEIKSMTEQKFGGQEQKIPSTMMTVTDGDYQYTYNESAGQKSAFRQKVNPTNQINVFDGKRLFADLERDYQIKVLPDETVDGRSCYVLEMTPKSEMAKSSGMTRSLSYFDKEDGIIRKSVFQDKDGKTSTQMTVSDVKINPPIPADRFKFTAPAGVTVQDMPS